MLYFKPCVTFVAVLIFLSCGKSSQNEFGLSTKPIKEGNSYARSHAKFKKVASLHYSYPADSAKALHLTNNGIDMTLENPWAAIQDLNSGMNDIGCSNLRLIQNTPVLRESFLQLEVLGFQGEFYPSHEISVFLNGQKQEPGQPLILAEFSEQEEKNYLVELCLQLEASDLPAQPYAGQISISYYQNPCPVAGCDTEFNCAEDPRPEYRVLTCHAKIASPVYLGERVRLPFKIEKNNIRVIGKGANSRSKFLGLLAKNMDTSDHIFQAPDSLVEAEQITIMGKDQSGKMTKCLLDLVMQPSPQEPEAYYHGIDMKLFNVENNGQEIDFDALLPDIHVKAMELDFPKNHWINGYKGYQSQKDWVGMTLEGELCVPQSGRYNFQFQLDDSGDLFIDQQKILILTNPPNQLGDVEIDLNAGWHPIKVHYYQGPRYKIDISLQWQHLDSLSPLAPIPHHLLRFSQ